MNTATASQPSCPSRRDFLHACAGLAAFTTTATLAPRARTAEPAASIATAKRMRLGLVTYNLAKDWTIETIIKNCEASGFEGVELRTTHAHGVEVSLSAAQRQEVRKRFADSKVELMGLGSAFDYHTPDPAKLRQDIEDTKQYIVLARDVGATGVKVRPNAFPKEVPQAKTLEQIGRSLRELGEFAGQHGQFIRLEVHGSGTSLLPHIRTMMEIANHPNVGVCWNSNQSDLEGDGFDANFDLVKDKIIAVHMRDLFLEEYPFLRLLRRLRDLPYHGYCLAEIPESTDPLRVMRYFRALWLAYQA